MDNKNITLHQHCINKFYEAASGACTWEDSIELLRSCVGSDIASITYLHSQRLIIGGHAVGLSDCERERYLRDCALNDPMPAWELTQHELQVKRVERELPVQSLFMDRPVVGQWYEQVGIHYNIAGHVLMGNGRCAMLSMQRSGAAGEFSDAAVKHTEELLPHLHNALELASRIRTLETQTRTLGRLVAGAFGSVIVCDDSGRVLDANGEAEQRLRDLRGVLRLNGGVLEAVDSGINSRLQTLLQGNADQKERFAPILTIPTELGFQLECIVLTGDPEDTGNPLRIVILRAPGDPPEIDTRFLRYRLEITRSEAEVLALLMQGRSLEAIADHRGSTIETVRSYVKKLLTKLHCHSRSELVAKGWQASTALILRPR